MPEYVFTPEQYRQVATLLVSRGVKLENLTLDTQLINGELHDPYLSPCAAKGGRGLTVNWKELLDTTLPVCHQCAPFIMHEDGATILDVIIKIGLYQDINARAERILSAEGPTKDDFVALEEDFHELATCPVLPDGLTSACESLNLKALEAFQNPLPLKAKEVLLKYVASVNPLAVPGSLDSLPAKEKQHGQGWVILVPQNDSPALKGYFEMLRNEKTDWGLGIWAGCATFAQRLLLGQYKALGSDVYFLPGDKETWNGFYERNTTYQSRFAVFEVAKKPTPTVMETFGALVKGAEKKNISVLRGLYRSARALEEGN